MTDRDGPRIAAASPATERLRGLLTAVRTVHLGGRDVMGARLRGEGDVSVSIDPDGSILLSESGTWRDGAGPAVRFTNAYRWRFEGHRIRLSHERRGSGAAVPLVDLVRCGPQRFESTEPHVCGEDRYTATVRLAERDIVVRWRVSGPRKTQLIRGRYRAETTPRDPA